MEKSKRRFVDEYANYKKAVLRERARENEKSYPDACNRFLLAIPYVENIVKLFHQGYYTVDETMSYIANAEI